MWEKNIGQFIRKERAAMVEIVVKSSIPTMHADLKRAARVSFQSQ
jgi:hypothetical protein